VHVVVFRHERIDDWHQVTPLIFVKQDGSGKRPEDRASEALKDISSELKEQGVLEIFEEAKLRFVADKVNQVTTYQEDDILLFEGTSS